MINKDLLRKMVDKYQYKNSVCYPKTDERIYCNLRTFYIIAFSYLSVFGLLLAYSSYKVDISPKMYLWYTIASVLIFAAAFIFMFFKLNIISLILNCLAAYFKLIPLIDLQIMNAGVTDIKPAFYWQHLLPLVLVFVASIWMCVISTREKYLLRRDTKRVMANLYEKHHTEDMSEEDWDNFLSSYTEE